MTAVQSVKCETRSERIARERKEWIADAVQHMIMVGLYDQAGIYDALYLAESLHYDLVDEDGKVLYIARDVVDEELTYWGE